MVDTRSKLLQERCDPESWADQSEGLVTWGRKGLGGHCGQQSAGIKGEN